MVQGAYVKKLSFLSSLYVSFYASKETFTSSKKEDYIKESKLKQGVQWYSQKVTVLSLRNRQQVNHILTFG